jgi:hypothetical protein
MPRLCKRARNTDRRTRNAQLVHDRRLNWTVEEHSKDNVNLRDQVACTRANENSEQRNQRPRANTLRQLEARQRECNQRRMQDNPALTRASLNRISSLLPMQIQNSYKFTLWAMRSNKFIQRRLRT